jgi:hypothetical protein
MFKAMFYLCIPYFSLKNRHSPVYDSSSWFADCFFFCPFCTRPAQQSKSFTVSGYVKDASTGESLLGTIVYIWIRPKAPDQCVWFLLHHPACRKLYDGDKPAQLYQTTIQPHLDKDIRQNVALVPLVWKTRR